MPELYVYVHKAYTETIFYTQTHLVFDELRANGAHVLVGDDFKNLAANPTLDDKLIVYGNVDFALDVVNRFIPKNRWLYVVDEGGAGQAAYDRSLGYMKKVNIQNIIVTYQNEAHLAKLTAAGAQYVIMPQCVPLIRPGIEKTGEVLISGQMSQSVYPTRTLVADSLRRHLFKRVHVLPYPGCDTPTLAHNVYGERYYQLLDGFRMGVTCRAGSRDRFVAKYAEMAASHVLPVGDCPSYMPRRMSRAMLNVEGLTDKRIADEVAHLLDSPEELQARTDEFTAVVAERYLVSPNMKRVVDEIKSH